MASRCFRPEQGTKESFVKLGRITAALSTAMRHSAGNGGQLGQSNASAGYIKSSCSELRNQILAIRVGKLCRMARCPMPHAHDLLERSRMFEERADRATDPISRQHYREMAAHHRSLAVEHREISDQLENELAQ